MSFANETPIRLLLIDRHAIVRAGLCLLVESWPGFKVVGEANGRTEAIEIGIREEPDVVLLNIDSDEVSNGLECIAELTSNGNKSRTVVLTGSRDPETCRRAVDLGAMGFVLAERGPGELRRAIVSVHGGEVWVDRKMMTSIVTSLSCAKPSETKDSEQARINSLTDREREVICLVCEGIKNQEIADRLFISLSTVRHHLTSIFSKLHLVSRFELIIFAHHHRLASLSPQDQETQRMAKAASIR